MTLYVFMCYEKQIDHLMRTVYALMFNSNASTAQFNQY